ncbi:pua rna binding domain-containing protein [Diplodia corticola]|uniref:Pua rna binding domain-containing protein n=1 Tax=Diplodia corticola TaxID=236234 RepID=A0A1J9RBY5_9PEZI|nr:pua rna binding domain-containing protein [Diplodia corticola]OJD37666.1 pua rna binding domain-containing protein [Diplodia corticola]
MPLVVPGINSTGDKTEEWTNHLVGKKIGDSSDTITFAKKDLPEKHRILKEGDAMTFDHNPDRLNIHVADDGTVRKVTHG